MKTALCTLLIHVALAVAAFAGPQLVLDTVVTDWDAHGKGKILGRFHILTKNGKQTVMPVGEFKYAVTPTLHNNSSVDVSETMIQHYARTGKTYRFGPFKQNKALGEERAITIGSVAFSTKVSLAK